MFSFLRVHLFNICRDDFQGPAAAEYAVNAVKAKRIFIIQDKTAYGQGMVDAFMDTSKKQDIQSNSYDLIVTTFLHVEEVEEKMRNMSLMHPPKVVACLLESNLMAMKHLQRLPKGSKVGIACTTWEGTRNIRKSILQSGRHHFELVEGAGEAPDTISQLIKQHFYGCLFKLCSPDDSFSSLLICWDSKNFRIEYGRGA